MTKYQKEVEKLKKVHNEVKGLIDRFPPEKREQILFDKWSLKDVVAHLSHWMEDDINALENHVNGKKSYWWPDVDEFNRIGVEKRKPLSWDNIYEEFVTLMNRLHDTYKKLPEDLFEKGMWGKHNGTPLRSVKVDIDHWKGEHIPSLTKVLRSFN